MVRTAIRGVGDKHYLVEGLRKWHGIDEKYLSQGMIARMLVEYDSTHHIIIEDVLFEEYFPDDNEVKGIDGNIIFLIEPYTQMFLGFVRFEEGWDEDRKKEEFDRQKAAIAVMHKKRFRQWLNYYRKCIVEKI